MPSYRILVIDDEPTICRGCQLGLAETGHAVLPDSKDDNP